MRIRVGDIQFLLALFQQMDADGYKPVNRITGVSMAEPLKDLRRRIESEYEARAYGSGRRAGE